MPRAVVRSPRPRSLFAVALLLATLSVPVRPQAVSFEERLLATVPKDLEEYTSRRFIIGSAIHGLYQLGRADRWQPVFSRDGRHVAYLARRDERAVVVVDGKEGPTFDAIYDFVFSADGSRFAYVGRNGKELDASRWTMVTDHQPGPEYDDVGIPVFSPDGARLLHTASRVVDGRTRALVVENGRVVGDYDWAGDIAFSPDGKTIAIASGRIVGDSLRCSMAVGTEVGPEFPWVGLPTWSTDGVHFAYVVRSGALQMRVMRDGAGVLDAVSVIAIRFMGGRVVANVGGPLATPARGFVEGTGIFGSRQVAAEGSASAEYDEVGLPAISADEKHLAFGARNMPKGMRNFQAFLVVDGQESKLNRGLTAGVITLPHVPSGIGNFYVTRVGDRHYAGIDRSRLFLRFESLFRLAVPPLAFSPDAQSIAYTDWSQIHIGEQKSDRFDWAGPPVFSPDGKKVAFGARKGRELWWKVMEVK
jgi:hypothetical protein